MSLLNKKSPVSWLPDFSADFLAIVLAYYSALYLRFFSSFGEKIYSTLPKLIADQHMGDIGTSLESFYFISAPRIILIMTVVICFLYAMRGLYAGRRFLLPQPVAWNILVANTMALGLFYAYWYLQRNTHHPRSLFATIIVLNVIYCIALRSLIERVMQAVRRKSGIDVCRALLVGSGRDADFIDTVLDMVMPHGIIKAGRIALDRKQPFDAQLKQIEAGCSESDCDLLIVAEKDLSVSEIMRILERTDKMGIPAKILSEKLSILTTHARLPCDMIYGTPLVHFGAPKHGGKLGVVRQLITVFSAVLSLIVLAPLMLLTALLVRLTSQGPAIFVQERIGINRKPFKMYKFRTMHDRAEELLAQIEEFNETSETMFKIKKDPRITPIGRLLRRFSIDELPQLFNVIKGDMVIVGPRPLPRRDFENYYEEWHYSRHRGLPGLTCLWQVSGRSNIDFHNMCILDVYYLRNHSWILDLEIILRTVKVVLFGIGAY